MSFCGATPERLRLTTFGHPSGLKKGEAGLTTRCGTELSMHGNRAVLKSSRFLNHP